MPQTLQLIVAVLAHNLGSIILVGSLVFVQVAYLPAIADVRTPQARMELRMDALSLLFRWVWVAIALLYLSGGWAIVVSTNSLDLPTDTAWTLGLSLLLLAMLAWGYMGLFWAAEQAMIEDRVKVARQLYGWLNWVLRLSLLLAVLNMLLGVSGPMLMR